MTKKRIDPIDHILAQQSSEWLEVLKNPDGADNAKFAAWLLESKRNVRHFLTMNALDQELRRFDPERRHQVPQLSDADVQVVQLEDHSDLLSANAVSAPEAPLVDTAPRFWRRTAVQWSVAAALAAVVIGLVPLGLRQLPGKALEITTDVGEQRAVELSDGSVVHLNTRSRVEVQLTDASRDIRLLEGEAQFKVHQETGRPFRVHANGVVVQALGTQFNVYDTVSSTIVSVLDGRVGVSAGAKSKNAGDPGLVVESGQEVEVRKDGPPGQKRALSERRMDWTQRRLSFKRDPLTDVVAEFNRYNRVPHFEVADAKAGERRYTGVFDADDPKSLQILLAKEPELQVSTSGNTITIRSAAGNTDAR